MLQYSNEQLATIIGVPIVTILLIWTVAIFHKNRKKWNSYDIAVVAILVQSVLRNLAILGYTALLIAKRNSLNSDYCRAVVWIFNSVHTFQASSLTTLAVTALFTVKLCRKQQHLQQYLTPTHVIYHLFCLTTLCACVGVAAILAQEDVDGPRRSIVNFGAFDANKSYCKFMPFELDIKFNIFIIVLHIFLAMVSLTSFIFICLNHIKMRRQGFDYLKKSTSDLSELSLSLTASVVNPSDGTSANGFGTNRLDAANGLGPNGKAYYDTYTIQRIPHLQLDGNFAGGANNNNNYEGHVGSGGHGFVCHNGRVGVGGGGVGGSGEPMMWNSDLSNISMTVSSTNSKRPCLNKGLQDEEEVETGLHTMYPILAVCYLFNHLPLIILCIFPRLVSPFSVSGVALWMGQLQDVLIPIGLGLVDSRFCKWVSKVYKCSDRRTVADKVPPGVGLDGKFRHFGSQPQSLEISQRQQHQHLQHQHLQQQQQQQPHGERPKGYSSSEPKFPITNGSLYTSIDGRLPIIHNYRRHKDQRGFPKPISAHSLNVNLHSSHLKRQEYIRPPQQDFHPYQAHGTASLDVPMPYPKQRPCAKCDNQHLSSQLNLHFVHQMQQRREARHLRSSSPFDEVPRLRHHDHLRNRRHLQKRISLSQDSLNCRLPVLETAQANAGDQCEGGRSGRRGKPRGRRCGLGSRMSKSEDSLSELQKDLQKFKQNPEMFEKKEGDNETDKSSRQDLSCISSDDEYFTDSVNMNDANQDYDATSQSSYSITTEANCDFEFYQSKDMEDTGTVIKKHEEDVPNGGLRRTELTTFKQISLGQTKPPNFTEQILARSNSRSSKSSSTDLAHFGRNFRITRSNSKRSLENFHSFIDEEVNYVGGGRIQRSNSYMTIEDRKKFGPTSQKIPVSGSNGKTNVYLNGSEGNGSGLLQNLNANIAYLEDIYNHNVEEREEHMMKQKKAAYTGSVPDFKKIFISEYI